MDIGPRNKYGINILTVKNADGTVLGNPTAEYAFIQGDKIVVFGETNKIIQFSDKEVG